MQDWFDSEIWRQIGTGEFRTPLAPETLLEPCPEPIWPGFMPPDVLPLIGNEYGDWLCLRVGDDDSVREVVYWYHGGGDWIPWGQTLPEAIAFQMIRDSLPGRFYRHADPAEPIRLTKPDDPLFQWASKFLPETVTQAIAALPDADSQADPLARIEDLLKLDIATIPLHAEAILRALDSPLRTLTPGIANRLGIDWGQEALLWMFDHKTIPENRISDLAKELGAAESEFQQQDWDLAGRHADKVLAERSDLGWAHHTAGWQAERNGDLQTAVKHYSESLISSSFTEQGVRFRTHGKDDGKFSARRLLQITNQNETLEIPQHQPYWNRWSQTAGEKRVQAVAAHWRSAAQQAVAAGQHAQAYPMLINIGWDLGLRSVRDYGPLLWEIATTAERAGQAARAAVAATHARCFEARYGSGS